VGRYFTGGDFLWRLGKKLLVVVLRQINAARSIVISFMVDAQGHRQYGTIFTVDTRTITQTNHWLTDSEIEKLKNHIGLF